MYSVSNISKSQRFAVLNAFYHQTLLYSVHVNYYNQWRKNWVDKVGKPHGPWLKVDPKNIIIYTFDVFFSYEIKNKS